MVHIEINPDFQSMQSSKALLKAAQAALEHAGPAADSELSILLTSDEAIQALNQQHRHENQATDVLSFPSQDLNPESGATYLGDIVIACPTAQRQAEAAGHPLEAELQLLAVHGVLHLLGYDHADAGEQARMWAAQRAILDQLGLDIGWEHASLEHD